MKRIHLRVSSIIIVLSLIIFGVYLAVLKHNDDSVAPTITCKTDTLEISINDSEEVILANATASDNRDGDITDKIVIETISKFSDPDNGIAKVTYAVCDSSENIARTSCTLVYTDYTPIRFTINSSTRCKLSSAVTPLSFVTAVDCIDGDVTRKIRYEALESKDFSVYNAGSYGIRYSVVNSMGDTEYFDVLIDVYNPPTNVPASYLPVLYLTQYNVYLKVGDTFTPSDYISYAVVDGENVELTTSAKKKISASHDVDTSKPGTYRVVYEYTPKDSTYDVTATAILYVVVE